MRFVSPTASLRTLVPPTVEVGETRVHTGDDGLYPQEREHLVHAVETRRREFATVRACAAQVLDRLGLDRPPMLPGPAGEPTWPAGTVGSMTHCAGYGAAVAARSSDIIGVGVDAEPHDTLPDGVLEAITGAAERDALGRLGLSHPGIAWDRLLFSAKESMYKLWFPLAREWLGFTDADVRFADDGTFEARLTHLLPDPVGGPGWERLRGGWTHDDEHVLTALVLPREDRPGQAGTR